jgi:transcriptional regulator with XRE-family HTH domain
VYGQNIRLFRKQKGMNQHELGAAMDVSAVSVSKWEREQTQPDIETLQKLAPTLGVTLEWLVSGQGEAPPAELRVVPDGDARPSLGAHPDAEALANRRQHTLHGLCRCPAQVQGQAEITKKKRQLRHGLFMHGDQSG